jgi:hypothetical protein
MPDPIGPSLFQFVARASGSLENSGEIFIMGSKSDGDVDGPRKRRRINPAEIGPYLVTPLLDKVQVAVERDENDVHITSVEYWSMFYLTLEFG